MNDLKSWYRYRWPWLLMSGSGAALAKSIALLDGDQKARDR